MVGVTRVVSADDDHCIELFLDQLEDQEIAVVAFDEVMDPAHGRVVELGKDARLAQKARLGHGVEPVLAANGLDRHRPLQLPGAGGRHVEDAPHGRSLPAAPEPPGTGPRFIVPHTRRLRRLAARHTPG